MGAHTTSDDPTRYRLNDDLEHWKLKDPIARVEAYLKRGGHADDAFFAGLADESDALAATLREGCLALPEPNILDMFDRVYGDTPPDLLAQRDQYASYLASFEGSH
jgi:pyruvate dehydrogenase E1 component alpha subunit